MSTEHTVHGYLNALASNAPAPGGGSATALAGALAAALNSMVANFTVGRPKYGDVDAEVRAILAECEELRARLMQLMAEDEEAYGQVAAAYKLPKTTDDEKAARKAAIQDALRTAAGVPLETARCCARVLRLAEPLVDKGNVMLISDAGVAARLANGGLHSAWLNVEVNLRSIEDEAFNQEKRDALAQLTRDADELLARLWGKLLDRM